MHVHSPIFVSLFQIAAPNMSAYLSDLGHDTLALSTAKVGSKYVWGWSEMHTYILDLSERNALSKFRGTVECHFIPDANWHLIYVTEVRNGVHADGFIAPVKVDSSYALKRRVEDFVLEGPACMEK